MMKFLMKRSFIHEEILQRGRRKYLAFAVLPSHRLSFYCKSPKGAIESGMSFLKQQSRKRNCPMESCLNVELIFWTANMFKVSTRLWSIICEGLPGDQTMNRSADKVKWFALNLSQKGNNTFFKSSRSSKVLS